MMVVRSGVLLFIIISVFVQLGVIMAFVVEMIQRTLLNKGK